MNFTAVSTSINVRPGDLDIAGHVNNARALEYFEHGRWTWLAHHGLERYSHVVPVVTRVEVDYRRELFWGEITIHTALVEDAEAIYKAVFNQSIEAEPGQAAVNARVEVAFIDRDSRQLCMVEEFLSGALNLDN